MVLLEISNVAVIGAGEMGHGIAQVFATYGFNVRLMDKYPGAIEKAKERVKSSLQRGVERGKLKPEKIELKKQVFAELENFASHDAIFATNTSNIRITDLAKATKRPERFAGL